MLTNKQTIIAHYSMVRAVMFKQTSKHGRLGNNSILGIETFPLPSGNHSMKCKLGEYFPDAELIIAKFTMNKGGYGDKIMNTALFWL